MANRLRNKIALVTGAGQGIGEGIARMMSAEGASVFFADRTVEKASAAANPIGERAIALDVTEPGQWADAAREIDQEFGRLDILVNNAGIVSNKSIAETPLEEWRQVMSVNLDGMFIGAKTLLPLLRAATQVNPRGAAVVNISSTMGIVAMSNQLAYGSSKAGVRHFSKLLAIEWAEAGYNIRVNSIHPGSTRTKMFEKAVFHWAQTNTVERTLESGAAAMAALNPVRRLAAVEDIAYGAVYLASDEATFVTGAELVIDGGYVAR